MCPAGSDQGGEDYLANLALSPAGLGAASSAEEGGWGAGFCLGAQPGKLKLQWEREGRHVGIQRFRLLFLVGPEPHLIHPKLLRAQTQAL